MITNGDKEPGSGSPYRRLDDPKWMESTQERSVHIELTTVNEELNQTTELKRTAPEAPANKERRNDAEAAGKATTMDDAQPEGQIEGGERMYLTGTGVPAGYEDEDDDEYEDDDDDDDREKPAYQDRDGRIFVSRSGTVRWN